MNRQRLEAESLWDTIHSVAGTLNLEMGGRPVMPPLTRDALTNKAVWNVNSDPKQHVRRGIYIIVRRNFQFPLFGAFDAPVNAVSCPGRDCSTVAPQALWLLNNDTAAEQSQQFAARLIRDAGQDRKAWIDRGWRLALGRPPDSKEMSEAEGLLTALEHDAKNREPASYTSIELQKLAPSTAASLCEFCLTLFNLHEFIFID